MAYTVEEKLLIQIREVLKSLDSGSTIVTATDLDIRNLAASQDNIRIGDGTTNSEVVPLAGYNSLAVAITDGSGNQITSFGGTQYTEDAVAAADPIGTAVVLIADSTPALEVAEGDNVAQRGTRYGAAYTQIVSSAGAFIDTFGGGTQYTEGDVDATITGGVVLMEVAANTVQPIQGTVADGLLVNLGANNDVTINATANTTATTTSVNDSAASQTLLASNANRKGAMFWNESDQILYVKLGGAASIAAGGFNFKLLPQGYAEIPFSYSGVIHGIWVADSTGYVNVTEITA